MAAFRFIVVFLAVVACVSSNVLKFKSRDHDQYHVEAPEGLDLVVNKKTGSYQLSVRGSSWLESAPTFFTVRGKQYSTASGGGLILNRVTTEMGSDELGPWNATTIHYSPENITMVDLSVSFKQYYFLPHVYLFGQFFGEDIDGTSVGHKQDVCTGFPSFVVNDATDEQNVWYRPNKVAAPELGYLAYGGIMFGDTSMKIGRWDRNGVKGIMSGLDSGPLVLFSSGSEDTLVISSFSEFMAVSAVYAERGGQMTASWGLMGNVTRIPRDFNFWTIVSYSAEGVNMAMERWGEILRIYHRRGTEYRDSDMTNNYIGFWTDNGAYYYYNTEAGLNYESTILLETNYSHVRDIPYRYIQYDSWFYYKGSDEGVKEWVARPDIFPDGAQYTWNKTGFTVVAHNRWWSSETVYARENGGKFDFIVEKKTKKAIPVEQTFWDDLLKEAKKWGLIVYEQDWLNDQFDEMDITVSDVYIGSLWLNQMGKGARKNGLTIQYCMAPSRHALHSLLVPVVTSGRVSTDYQPGNDNWQIGVSSMFAHALGVAPFKDNFWTITNQPGNPYNKSEPYPELQSVVATLSTGPVAPSDRIGYSNRELIMRSCNTDGLILKPSKPATAIDFHVHGRAFGQFSCQVWSTYSYISGWLFGIVLAADCKHDEKIVLNPMQAGFRFDFRHSVAYSWFNPKKIEPFNETSPLTLQDCKKDPFCLYVSSPVITIQPRNQAVVLQGELDKWVSMSPQRVRDIRRTEDDVFVSLQGGAFERLTFSVNLDGVTIHIPCLLSPDGFARLSVNSRKCMF